MTDARYALRSLRRAPGFTAIAVATLALGIGANTAIFSLVRAVILKPLPYRDAARLVTVWDTYPQYARLGISPVELEAWQRQTDLFEDAAWYRHVAYNLNLTEAGAEALEVHATFASERLLPLLGAAPAMGRAFAAGEPPNSVLLSHRLWQTRFGGSPAAVGRAIRLNDQEYTVLGVMPASFAIPEWADVWLPRGPLQADEMTNPVRHAVAFLARLRPGVTRQQADARLGELARRLTAEHPKTSRGFAMHLYGLQDDLTARTRPALLLLWGAVALVLLIACANVANLLLSRARGRRKEIALRTALGAGMGRLVRQFVTESLVLAALGGGLGLLLARWGLTAFSPVEAPLDSQVLLFLLAVTAPTGVLFGLAPAAETLRTAPGAALKSGARAGGALVVLEFALALMLAVGTGILAKSFLRLMHVDPGFEPRGLLTLRLSIPPSRDTQKLFRRIEESFRALPGVTAVAETNTLPIAADRAVANRFNVPGSPLINPDSLPAAQTRYVSTGYFATMGIPLLAGRTFTEAERTAPVVIVNQTMARRFWPGRDPVGLKFVTGPFGPNPTVSTIVGVAGDVKQFGLDSEPTMDMYFPDLAPRFLVVRTAGDAAALGAAAGRALFAIDAGVPVSDVRTMEEILAQSSSARRWTMALLAAFAGLAVALALVGIYGVMAWSVAQRTREIGIRMALGAGRAQVLGSVMARGVGLSAAGIALGLAGAFALRRVLATLVFDVSTADPALYGAVALAMLGVALAACWVPARRASRVDPAIALRWE